MAKKTRVANLFAAIVLVCGAAATGLGAQSPAYDHPVDFRLEAFAKALEVSPDRLLEGRKALRRVTEATDVMTPQRGDNIDPLIAQWKKLDPDSLPGAFTFLFEQIREDAREAQGIFTYAWVTMTATNLVAGMLDVDPARARELADTWPPPSYRIGQSGRDQYRHFWDRVLAISLEQIARVDVDRAMVLDAEGDYPLHAAARGMMVSRLLDEGRTDEALSLAREVIDEYRNSPVDTEVAVDFSGFVDRLLRLALQPFHKDLYREAWTLALEKGAVIEEPHSVLSDERGSPVEFTTPEVLGLYQLAFLKKCRGGKWLSSQLLKAFPGLDERVERVGGLEGFVYQKTYHGPPTPGCCGSLRPRPRSQLRPPTLPGQWDVFLQQRSP
ncbi:MAG: hypothetical protein WAO20_02180 [Acidobacteriota bacterium]